MGITHLLGRIQIESERFLKNKFFHNKVFPGYSAICKKQEFEIYRANDTAYQIVAAFNSVVVTQKVHSCKQRLLIYPDYSNRWLRYCINFNEKNFPGLIKGSKVMNCLIVPYLREVSDSKFYKRWRLIVFTDKAQIYHNFPAREMEYEGLEQYGDIKRFEESAVWDIPGKKYPSANQNCDETEQYFPVLCKECYEYHPGINRKSKYGNSGFDKYTYVENDGRKVKVPRFYLPSRCAQSNPFAYMGGVELDYKITLIGTYQSNKSIGARTDIFATSDGGRNWYAKYDFADEGEYPFKQGIDTWGQNYGNPINGSALRDIVGKIWIRKKKLKHSEESDEITWEAPIVVDQIVAGNPIKVKTQTAHFLSNGNIIALCSDEVTQNGQMGFLFNNEIKENCGGNGILYKVKVINEDMFELYENVSNPFIAVACRHIHHINRVRDGWIVGTGEIFPNGWLFYIQMREADTYTRIVANSELKFFKLNSAASSVQRTIGADIIDGKEPRLIYASDHDLLDRPEVALSNGVRFTRNSTGIYEGNLSDINDFRKFKVIFEAKEPAYFFKKLDGKYVFSGQRGEIAVSDLSGHNWELSQLDQPLIHYKGRTYRFHVIDKYLIIIK